MAGAVHPRPMSPCTAPILVLNRSVVRSTGLPKRSRVSGVLRRRRDQAGVAARRSTQLAQHRPKPRPRTTGASQLHTATRNFGTCPHLHRWSLTAFPATELHRHFSVPLNERARHSPKFIFGRAGAGVAQLGVSRRGRRFVVRASRSLSGAKKHRTAAVFRVSVASNLPTRIPIVGPICAMGRAALSPCDRRNSTSVISRPAPGV